MRFTSRRAIRESLTGRLSSVELFPFVLSELRSDVLPDFLPRALASEGFAGFSSLTALTAQEHQSRLKDYHTYLERGGLPGICFVREAQTRHRLLQDVLRTLLDRDLRMVYETPLPLSDLMDLCFALASRPFQPFSVTSFSRALGLAPRTVNHLLSAFESIFLVRRIPIEGGGRRGFLVWFGDQFEQNFLSRNRLAELDQKYGPLYRNLRAQFEYRLGATPTYFHYRTRGGAVIPLAIRTEAGVLGFLHLPSRKELSRTDRAAMRSFLSAYGRAKVLIVTDAPDEFEFELVDDRVLIVPVTAVL